MRLPIQVLVFTVRRADSDEWEYLLLHRVPTTGDLWQGVTGGVEENEGCTEAARRELIEETGLAPLSIDRIDYSYSFPVGDSWQHFYAAGVEEIKEYVFVAYVSDQEEVNISDEHDDYRWCRFDEALELLYWPGEIEALKRCHEVVLTQG